VSVSSRVAAELAVSPEGLSSLELVYPADPVADIKGSSECLGSVVGGEGVQMN
jgi:hypothetical protein